MPSGPAFFLLALAANGTFLAAETYHCRPDVKYECSATSCDRITEDFRHAENFIFAESDNTLVACLWTACYEGIAYNYANPDGFTAVGRLLKDGTEDETMLVSISVSKDRRFTASWNHSGAGTTLDIGLCETGR